jgi:hypothetical protein
MQQVGQLPNPVNKRIGLHGRTDVLDGDEAGPLRSTVLAVPTLWTTTSRPWEAEVSLLDYADQGRSEQRVEPVQRGLHDPRGTQAVGGRAKNTQGTYERKDM